MSNNNYSFCSKSLNDALHEAMDDNDKVLFIGEDILDPYGGAFKISKGLSTKFPDRVYTTPLSEAAIVGISNGLALRGFTPVVEIMFGDFIMLGADQLLNHLVKYEWMYNNKHNVPVTIRTTMGGRRGYGPTHSQSIEPILASIPGLIIISPSHFHDPGLLLENTVISESGVKVFCEYKMNYPKQLVNQTNCQEFLSVRYSEENYPIAYLSNCEFDDPEILIISHGGNAILIESLLEELLMEHELAVQANLLSLIKPILVDNLFDGHENCKMIIVIEESPKNFGWGSEIVASMAESGLANGKNIARIGSEELPIPSSTLLEEKILPSINDVLHVIKTAGMVS